MSVPEQMPCHDEVPACRADSVEQSFKVEKKRYEWIDNARIIAAWLIVCFHMAFLFPGLNNAIGHGLVAETTYCGRVPFFLILAGYFLARNITWSKAFDRALWLFVPFALWNFLLYAWWHHPFLFDWHQAFLDIPQMLGVGSIFNIEFSIFGLEPTPPTIPITWFLRDIIVLSLLTPIIAKARKYLLIVVVLAGLLYFNFEPDDRPKVLLWPPTCIWYILGVSLSSFKIRDAYLIMNKSFTPYVLAGLFAATCYVFLAAKLHLPSIPVTIFGGIFGALMIAHFGVLIEKHFPKLSKRLSPCGPACFLVFVLHYPLLETLKCFIPNSLCASPWIIIASVPICIVIIAFFLLLKRYTPWIMPYLCHMKVPKQKS